MLPIRRRRRRARGRWDCRSNRQEPVVRGRRRRYRLGINSGPVRMEGSLLVGPKRAVREDEGRPMGPPVSGGFATKRTRLDDTLVCRGLVCRGPAGHLAQET